LRYSSILLLKKRVKGHISWLMNERCYMKGEKHENTTVFCTFSDIKHHTGVPPFIYIEPIINMINHFILNPMHLFDEEVMKRLLHFWCAKKM